MSALLCLASLGIGNLRSPRRNAEIELFAHAPKDRTTGTIRESSDRSFGTN
jgi:hypothetical protein